MAKTPTRRGRLGLVTSSPLAPRSSPLQGATALARPRPVPPAELLKRFASDAFVPALDVTAWIRSTFVAKDAPLLNLDHVHLRQARIGVVWTNAANRSKGRVVVGTAELLPFRASGWQRARQEWLCSQWFGGLPDFLVTLSAPHLAPGVCSDASFCAVLEHELYHCGQARDPWGSPRFKEDGRPVFTMRGHDVEEFVGVVERYGADAAGQDVRQLVAAASATPLVAPAAIAGACGTCLAKVA